MWLFSTVGIRVHGAIFRYLVEKTTNRENDQVARASARGPSLKMGNKSTRIVCQTSYLLLTLTQPRLWFPHYFPVCANYPSELMSSNWVFKTNFRTYWLTLTLLCLLRRNSDSPHRCSALIPALGELFWMKAPAKSQICKCDVLICSPFFVLIRVFWFSQPVFISLMSIPLSRCLPRLLRCLLVAAH